MVEEVHTTPGGSFFSMMRAPLARPSPSGRSQPPAGRRRVAFAWVAPFAAALMTPYKFSPKFRPGRRSDLEPLITLSALAGALSVGIRARSPTNPLDRTDATGAGARPLPSAPWPHAATEFCRILQNSAERPLTPPTRMPGRVVAAALLAQHFARTPRSIGTARHSPSRPLRYPPGLAVFCRIELRGALRGA